MIDLPRVITIYIPDRLDIDSLLESAGELIAKKYGVRLRYRSRIALLLMLIGYSVVSKGSAEVEFMRKGSLVVRIGE